MKLRIYRFGKPAFPQFRKLCDVYQTRLSKHFKVELIELKSKQSNSQLLAMLQHKNRSGHYIIFLEETGVQLNSVDFANLLKKHRDDPRFDQISFVIGDPHGFDKSLLGQADLLLRFSEFTFTSDLCELLLWEQIYRACSIMSGSSYHHE